MEGTEHLSKLENHPWHSFDGFVFVSKGDEELTAAAHQALLSTDYLQALTRGDLVGDKWDAEMLTVVNLCVLFETLSSLSPLPVSMPDFWEVMSDKWGLLPDWKITRSLVIYYTRARKSFLRKQEHDDSNFLTEGILSILTTELAKLVDEWIPQYDEHMDRGRIPMAENWKSDWESFKQDHHRSVGMHLEEKLRILQATHEKEGREFSEACNILISLSKDKYATAFASDRSCSYCREKSSEIGYTSDWSCSHCERKRCIKVCRHLPKS